VGLIAGAGRLPWLAAQALVADGRGIAAVQLAETGQRGLRRWDPAAVTLSIGQVGALFDFLRGRGVRDVLFLGKVEKKLNFAGIAFDEIALSILMKLPGRSDGSIFAAVADEMADRGFRVARQTALLADWLAPEGRLAGPAPDDRMAADVARGMAVARALAAYDVGQTVVVKHGAVVAVEAFEHTNACLRRAGRLAGRGVVVCKVARPEQDPRFDVPVCGVETLRVLRRIGAASLALEAGGVLWLEQEKSRAFADQAGISIVGASLNG
jgi:DUF1009 family protein